MFEIKKDILTEEQLKHIQEAVTTDIFPWFYKPKLTHGKSSDGFLFQHYLYRESNPNSKFYYIIPDYFKKHLDYKALILSRINFNLPKKEKVCSRFHVDETYPCKTALFYINTTNATTIFENCKKVKGIENTLVIFDSMINHKVQFNTDGKERYVINFNYF